MCALIAATAFAAAACGSDEGDGKAASASTTAGGGAAATTAQGGGDEFGPSKDNPKVINGPEGYKIDLSKCPSNWKDTDGVSDTEIKLAHSFAFSGPLAANGGISRGIDAYLKHINATEGGVAGRKFSLTIKDDAYEAARVKANTDELLESVKPLAMPAMAGTPGNLAIYDKMNEVCVPHLFVASGHPAFADPVNHPWTTNSYLLYPPEGAILAEYVAATYGKGVTVAQLVLNNDFGLSYRAGFDKKAKELGINIVKSELFETSAPTVTNEVTTLASTNADVYVIFSAGTPCSQAISSQASTSWRPKGKVISSTCTGNYLTAAEGAAADYVGAYFRKDTSDGNTYKDDPDAQKVREILKQAGHDENEFNNNYGMWWALPLVQLVKEASARPGGLSRTNLMIASQRFRYDHPLALGKPGSRIKFETNGLKDVAYTEGAQTQRWTLGPDGKGRWVQFGDVIEQNGTTTPCAWDGKTCK
ncbi:MAG: ABC transporter substrate-binding protein [Acidimicrobiales bacterium]